MTTLAEQARAKLDAAIAARAPEPPPAVRLVRGDAIELQPVRWLWRGFLPAGMLTILGGAPGCGKTTIALSLAAVVTQGGAWPDGTPCTLPGDVLLWSGEDAQPVLAARLAAAGADLTRVHFIVGVTDTEDGAFDPGRDMALLEAAAAKLGAPRLLVLDPIVSAVSGDGHKSNEVRRSLQPVVDLAHRLECGVLGITHFSKGTAGRDPTERITGSLAFAALARMVLVAARFKGDDGGEPRRVMVKAKANDASDEGGFSYELERVEVAPEVEGQRVRWLEALQGSARDVLAEAEAEPDNPDGDSDTGADAFLRGLLADGPLPAKTIKSDADGAGYAWRTVQRAGTRLGVERRKDGLRGGWTWALTDGAGPRRRHEGAEDASTKDLAPTAPSVAPSGLGRKAPLRLEGAVDAEDDTASGLAPSALKPARINGAHHPRALDPRVTDADAERF
ncbi:MAG: AAA family ATPase [Burkholderiales bacterium]|nr:AAA family ATPase [Burkholderiales bacterium]